MTSVSTAATAPRLRPALGGEPRFLRGMSWTRVGWLFGIAGIFAASSVLGALIRGGGWPYPGWRDFVLDGLSWFVRYVVDFAPVLVTLTIADNLPLSGVRRVAALVAALVIGAQFQWPIICSYEPQSQPSCEDFPSHLARSYAVMLGDNTLWTVMYCTPIALAFFYRRRDRRVAEALHAAEVARADTQRQTLEAGLQAMQARVEPAFLFETLGDIGELYDRDPPRGESMLDELILYLRAALPDMRGARSTVKQEISLVRAYLAILAIRSQGALTFDIGVDAALDDAAMSPLILLPLLSASIGPTEGDSSVSSVRVDALADQDRLRVAITGRGAALRSLADAPVVAECRERLQALFGNRASLTVDGDPGRRLTAVLELPHEKA